MSSAGAGLAVSGISGGGPSAAESQYSRTVPTTETTPDQNGVLPSEDTGTPTVGDNGDTSPGDDSNPASEPQTVKQVASDGDDSLPFTGLAAIPMLLLGVGLLASGFVLRRSAGRDAA